MFTGIVETVGRVLRVERGADLARIVVESGVASEGAKLGDSIAVSGCCLTVTAIDGTRLTFEAVPETLQRTSLGDLCAGGAVNLERALRVGQRLDGHIVQGHVDGTGVVRALERHGDDVRLSVGCEPSLAELLVDKGSVAIDGVSLTVVHALAGGFDVALIPHTLEVTTLGRKAAGDRVNLEVDVLGKYVKKYVERVLGPDVLRAVRQPER